MVPGLLASLVLSLEQEQTWGRETGRLWWERLDTLCLLFESLARHCQASRF